MAKLFPFKLLSQRIGSDLVASNSFRTREQMIDAAKKLRNQGAENIQPFIWLNENGWMDDDLAVIALNTKPIVEQQLTFAQAADLLTELSKLKVELDKDQKEALSDVLANVYHITKMDLYPSGAALDLMQQENEDRARMIFSFGVQPTERFYLEKFEPFINGTPADFPLTERENNND